MDLFAPHSAEAADHNLPESFVAGQDQPLASRMRPRKLEDFAGQQHLLGPDGFLRRALEQEAQGQTGLGNIVLWGPPGSGKTTLALLLSQLTGRPFLKLSAVLDGLKELRSCLQQAQRLREQGQNTAHPTAYRAPLLFIDEIHRWNKAQQDALLPWVEQGSVLLVGATTENPAFELNNALLSRVRVLELTALEEGELRDILHKTLTDKARGLGSNGLTLDEPAQEYLLQCCGGDARRLLNALELLATSTAPDRASENLSEHTAKHILGRSQVKEFLQRQNLYDRSGDYHYDSISAFIKSVRGSDPDAALYWLEVMLQGGENPRFIWRRLLILAAEDIGLADPQALVQVQAAAQAFEWVGLPEGQYFLSQATLYLALAPKSNSVGAFWQAKELLGQKGAMPVPAHLRGHAKSQAKRQSEKTTVRAFEAEHGYLYPHDFGGNWVAQNYTAKISVSESEIYQPGSTGWEAQRAEELQRHRELYWEARQLEAAFEPQTGANAAGQRSESYYHNRHEILLVWDQLRCELARFGYSQGWDDLIIGQASTQASAVEGLNFVPLEPGARLMDLARTLARILADHRKQEPASEEAGQTSTGGHLSPALQPSSHFIRQEWLRQKQQHSPHLIRVGFEGFRDFGEFGDVPSATQAVLLPFLLQPHVLLNHFRTLPKEYIASISAETATPSDGPRSPERNFWQNWQAGAQQFRQAGQAQILPLLFLEEYLPAETLSLEKELLSIVQQLLQQLRAERQAAANQLSVFQELSRIGQQWQQHIEQLESRAEHREYPKTEQAWLAFCSLQIRQVWSFPYRQVLHEKLWRKYGRLLPMDLQQLWHNCYRPLLSALGPREPCCEFSKSYTLFALLSG